MRKNKQTGLSMPITLMFFMVIGMVTVVSVSLTSTTDSMVFRGVQKIQATELAESGVNVLYDRICQRLISGSNLTSNFDGMSLTSTLGGDARNTGTFSAKVLDVTYTDTEPAPGQAAGSVLRNYTFIVEGTGTAANGTESVITASFQGEVVAAKGAFSSFVKDWSTYPAAIQSNSTVSIVANSGFSTKDTASKNKEAHIIANQGVKWMTAAGAKEDITDPNVIDVEGFILVPNQPTPTYIGMTTSVSGLANPNGVQNYKTASAWINKPTSYTVVENGVTPLGQSLPFASQPQVDAWVNTWSSQITNHSNATLYSGTITSANIPVVNGESVLTSPAKVSGNFNVTSGTTIHLVPRSTNPEENVIFISGALLNSGNIVNHGVTLVSHDYSDTATASYKLSDSKTTFKDLEDVYSKAGLFAFGQPSPNTLSSEAQINLNSDVDGKYGLVYALSGYVKVTGNMKMAGIIMSGAAKPPSTEARSGIPGLAGGVTIAPKNGSGFTIEYERKVKSFTIPGRLVDNSQIIIPFRANNITDWRQLR